MEAEKWSLLRELFGAAVLLAPEARASFLDSECAGDPELRREVESLLRHDPGPGDGAAGPAGSAADTPALELGGGARSAASLVGGYVGKIRILSLLGKGGMGEVYVGFDETLQRRVAVKAIRARNRLAPESRARFLREARILSQLEHPHICRIYDYVEGDDSDFLVLELIDGVTLSEKIDSGLEPARRMVVAIQIAEVLAAAHAKGVVHRDLKPQNVMITADGETKVLDFGLARSEAGAGEPAAAGGDDGDEEPGAAVSVSPAMTADETALLPEEGHPDVLLSGVHTRRGQVVGTPVYMSPEQALGATVTTASDMYSYGLVLQTLFTGEAPYPDGLAGIEILARARRAETRPVTGIDRDLAAFIGQLKSVAPAARPTAATALERLRWIRNKPARRLRRLIAAAVLAVFALGGAKYTFDLKLARDEAKARTVQAEGLLGFMLEDLRTSLEPLGRLDMLDAVGDRAMEYFAAAPSGALTDEELSRQAQALTQIGEVRMSQLRYDEALTAFVQAYERAADLSKRRPEDGDRLFDRGQAEFWVGNTHLRRADHERTREWFGRYLDTCESLLELDPERDDWIREVAYGHHNLAVLSMEQGDLEAARAAFEDEVAVLTRLLERQPQDDLLRYDLADAFSWLGSTHRRRADFESASRAFEESSKLFSALVAEDPSNQRWQYWRALGQVYEADIAAITGARDRASELLGEGLGTLDRLVEADPSNRRWRKYRARAELVRARVLAAGGGLAEALREATAAAGELDELLAVEPTDRQALQLRILSWRLEGSLRLLLGESAAAYQALFQARSAAEDALRSADARDPSFMAELAATLVLLGQVESELGNPAEAGRLWQESIELLGREIEDTNDPDFLDPWIRAQLLLGRRDLALPILERLSAAGYRPARAWPNAESSSASGSLAIQTQAKEP